ncbi:MAG TPA: alpha-amylase family glycosyl hydrolase [Polyangiaceae bacterium]|nr:alpha-amylase family glycosyl hydrolase [Polyangiaceae bacterium]
MPAVKFSFHTGLRQRLFRNVTLAGSWDRAGTASPVWSELPMDEVRLADGSFSYQATLQLSAASAEHRFDWGVKVDTLTRGGVQSGRWAIAAELQDWRRRDQVRTFTLGATSGHEQYHLTRLSQLGANIQRKVAANRVRFGVWAPNARSVALVLGDPALGYIDNGGGGVTARHPMQPNGEVWEVEVVLPDPDNTVYMFEIVKDNGRKVYRTDLYSRCQVGSGYKDPDGAPGQIPPIELDGRVSCSFVMDPAKVEQPTGSGRYLSESEFWQDEFDSRRPVPTAPNELVIYELHVGALGFGLDRPGNIDDAIALLPYLEELGVNAVELLPISEFAGSLGWGYGTTHFCAVEFSSGGPDHLKAFVKACHQRGIAVIVDVVYNHYPDKAERAEWMYDSDSHEKNLYYWYEGKPSDYQSETGGYVDNISSGWAPAFHSEMVRSLFISSAAALVFDYHVDGFRVDQTTSIHAYPTLHADGREATQARIFGAKFLREFGRSLRLLRDDLILLAEDHSTFDEVLKPIADGGMGFTAKWYNDFYHHLIGDTHHSPNLLKSAGFGGDWGLDLTFFAGLLENAGPWSVVFHESHDEAGNSVNDGERSRRTLMTAVNQVDPQALSGTLRGYAEARARVVAGLNLLSAGVPMFFMGEEIGAARFYTNDDWYDNREDLWGDKAGRGSNLFQFYKDLIALRRRMSALRSAHLKVVHVHDDNRVIAFKRWGDHSEALVIATLSNTPYPAGYTLWHDHIPGGSWREVFSSDSASYGGLNYGNGGATLTNPSGSFTAVLPPNGFVVFERH